MSNVHDLTRHINLRSQADDQRRIAAAALRTAAVEFRKLERLEEKRNTR